MPLYLAGAKMLTNYPTSVVVHGLALNITVQSYNESLDFGLMADAKAMPDVRLLAESIAVAFDDVRGLVDVESAALAAAEIDASMVKTARKVFGRAVGSAVDTATGLMPSPLAAVARAVNQRSVKAAAGAVPKLAQKAMGDAVARLVRKPAPRPRTAARR